MLYETEVAKIFDADPKNIARILELSERHKILYHGVKKRDRIYYILQNGKRPSTPEGGYVSYWNTGSCLFTLSTDIPLSPFATYDSSFFNYAHNNGGMTLLTTDQKTLEEDGIEIEWKDNASITIPKIVKPENLSIIDIQRLSTTPSEEDRKHIERTMLKMLLEHLERYSPGSRINRKID